MFWGKNRLQNCSWDLKLPDTVDISVLSALPEHYEFFPNFLNGQHANALLKHENEKQKKDLSVIQIIYLNKGIKSKKMSFLMYKLFAKIKNLPHLSAVDHYLVEVTHNLRAFYHLLKSMALPTHLFIHTSRYAQVGLNYILSYCFFFF